MNIYDLSTVIDNIHKKCKCACNKKYNVKDIHIIATTSNEALIEMHCRNCDIVTIITVMLNPEMEIKNQNIQRDHKQITKNDILDVKNFLNNFDGDFKKIFTQEI